MEFIFKVEEPGTYKMTLEKLEEYGCGEFPPYVCEWTGGVLVGTVAELALAIQRGEKLINLADTAFNLGGGKVPFDLGAERVIYNAKRAATFFTDTVSGTKSFPGYAKMGINTVLAGVDLRGPDGAESSPNNMLWHGLELSTGNRILDCRIHDWPYAGLADYMDGHQNQVLWCDFDHNQRTGYGYGIETGNGHTLIKYCTDDFNRHLVCGLRGLPGTGYEACYLKVGEHHKYSILDCHGSDPGYESVEPGGGIIQVHHVTSLCATQPLFKDRGIPTDGVDCWRNQLPAGMSPRLAFQQTVKSQQQYPYIRMHVKDNRFGELVVA